MATNMKTTLYTFVFFFFTLFLSSSSDGDSSSCDTTPYPAFCKTTLPSEYHYLSAQDQCRFYLQQSLLVTKTIYKLVSTNLRDDHSAIPYSTKHAIEDCFNLEALNTDFLNKVLQAIENNNVGSYQQVYDLQTLLSAVLTNHETCLDGFNEVEPYPIVTRALLSPLSNATKLYSMSLSLFTRGWVSNDAAAAATAVNRKLLQTRSVDRVLVTQKVVVSPNGNGDFTTINDAVQAAPDNTRTNNGYHVIYVVAGIYSEYVSIPPSKQNLMLFGEGINRTVIIGNRCVDDGLTVFQTATFGISGTGFVAVNITFRNTAGSMKKQAVALRNGADKSAFYRCSFEGYQDTLHVHSMTQFYKKCDIYGTVDFIFGNAAAVFQECNIYPRLPKQGQFNAIVAQGRTQPNQTTGITIQNCKITAASDLGNASNSYNGVKTYLGRPWKEYSRTVYMQSFIDDLIDPKGWSIWSSDFALNTLYYAEFANSGPGSNTSNRVTWEGYHLIDKKGASPFTVHQFIQGDTWLPYTGVPFKAGIQ